MAFYGVIRPNIVSPTLVQAPPNTPLERVVEADGGNGDWTKDWTVPSGEIWDILAVSIRNNTTIASDHDIFVKPLAGGIVPVKQGRAMAIGVATVWEPNQPTYLYPGDLIETLITDPGAAGDNKESRVLFRRYIIDPTRP